MGHHQSWKTYQKKLRNEALRKKLTSKSLWLLLPFAMVLLIAQISGVDLSPGVFTNASGTEKGPGTPPFDKQDFWHLIDLDSVLKASEAQFELNLLETSYILETTLHSGLQQYMTKKLQSSRSPLVSFVAMDPASGEVLSLIEFNRAKKGDQVCLSGRFPAASIFKIVSAAAAIECCNYSAESTLSYNGRKHTLYKNQLKNKTNRYTNHVSLKESFAQSINPTFGKLGVFRLKKELLSEYAARFGFNELIGFELPVEPSGFTVGEDPYEWAEIACGFNRTTVMSPLHGAMMAASILNGGELVEPTIIRQMTSENNQPVYKTNPHVIRQIVSPETSQELKKLMTETVIRGTSRRAFRGHRRDRVLSKLVIGGKTGSIKNKSDDLLYDWFVGFGEEKAGRRQLAIAVLVVHGTLLRTRAQEYARLALREYFRLPETPNPDRSRKNGK